MSRVLCREEMALMPCSRLLQRRRIHKSDILSLPYIISAIYISHYLRVMEIYQRSLKNDICYAKHDICLQKSVCFARERESTISQ
mmetsp:Transcript_13987/g.23875  ORF Transcript_13987/g.23875 Transcript_13987/m.23875 type:complete len:85 (+) Transcript_13987:754-1008(+)